MTPPTRIEGHFFVRLGVASPSTGMRKHVSYISFFTQTAPPDTLRCHWTLPPECYANHVYGLTRKSILILGTTRSSKSWVTDRTPHFEGLLVLIPPQVLSQRWFLQVCLLQVCLSYESRASDSSMSLTVLHFPVVDVVQCPCLSPSRCWESFQLPLIRNKRQLTLKRGWTESREISLKKQIIHCLFGTPLSLKSFLEICSNVTHPDFPPLTVSLKEGETPPLRCNSPCLNACNPSEGQSQERKGH